MENVMLVSLCIVLALFLLFALVKVVVLALVEYSKEKIGISKIRWLLCTVLGWHEPSETMEFDGYLFNSICKHCGKHIMQDSQGNWF